MKTLEEEAREYAKELVEARVIKDYQSGWMESVYLYITRNSKWVQAEKIKAQIDVLREVAWLDSTIGSVIRRYEQQLKQLEDDQ
jgi:hypothetical protein